MEIWPQMPVGVLNRSLGRALAWHARGHRFDPGILHQIKTATEVAVFLFYIQ